MHGGGGGGACVVGAYVTGCVCGGGHVWQGEGMCGRGHVWQGGMHDRLCVCGRGACMAGEACMAGGHAWQGRRAWQGGMHGRGHVWQRGGHVCRAPPARYCEMQSMSGLCASYWNAFSFDNKLIQLHNNKVINSP